MPEPKAIESFRLRHLELTPANRLAAPLSEVEVLDVVLVEALLADGGVGRGDAMLIDGATPETMEQAWLISCTLADAGAGLTADEAVALFERSHRVAPHTVTALTLAVETASGHRVPPKGEIPLVGLLDAADTETLEASVAAAIRAGHRALRLTLTGDISADLTQTAQVQKQVGAAARLRLDGNQAFTPEDAVAFAAQLDPSGVDWLMQPCVAGDWEAAAALKDASAVPTALSGFIYGPEDIATAAELAAADFVGLQLAQLGGFAACEKAIEEAVAKGLAPIIGGRLQSDLTTAMELRILLANERAIPDVTTLGLALEPLLRESAMVAGGRIILDGVTPALSQDTLAACTVQEVSFPR